MADGSQAPDLVRIEAKQALKETDNVVDAAKFQGVRLMTGAELKQLRKQLNLTVAEAAAQCIVSSRTWERWEASPKAPPGAVKLFKIENGLLPASALPR